MLFNYRRCIEVIMNNAWIDRCIRRESRLLSAMSSMRRFMLLICSVYFIHRYLHCSIINFVFHTFLLQLLPFFSLAFLHYVVDNSGFVSRNSTFNSFKRRQSKIRFILFSYNMCWIRSLTHLILDKGLYKLICLMEALISQVIK